MARGEVLQPSDRFHGPPLDPLQQVHVFLVLGTPELDAVLQVDPLFTVPEPPPPISSSITPQILPSYFCPSSSNIAAPVEQLLVRTHSLGVNTCEVGVVTEPECLGPCEPGTSVNLEGIVWHETEEVVESNASSGGSSSSSSSCRSVLRGV
ncbi:hypothetical protein QYF61_018440 [Mycteria americana]|uniref:Uncharacterized protein n=1 Tax=Mycteria americana TaxID=33587 RepID=A0AAN7MJE3_MYCAM|nr:hypothetical protein QYF61_018440 [Mycteria americana]